MSIARIFSRFTKPDEKENKVPHLVFDVDNVLAVNIYDPSQPYLEWFRKKNHITEVRYPYLFVPGAVELIRLLLELREKKKLRLSFFSAGTEKRNHDLLKALIILAVGREKYLQIKKEIKKNIFSREDLEPYHDFSGRYKKNLKTLIKKNLIKKEELGRVILIDDRQSNVKLSQLRNGLVLLKATEKAFCDPMIFSECNILAANQIYYLTGLFGTLFKESTPDNIANTLFKLQYSPSDTIKSLIAISVDECPDLTSLEYLLEYVSERNDNSPLLVRKEEQIFIYGTSDGSTWKLTELNLNDFKSLPILVKRRKNILTFVNNGDGWKLSPIEPKKLEQIKKENFKKTKEQSGQNFLFFPELGEENQCAVRLAFEEFQILHTAIKNVKGHIDFFLRPDLYRDTSLYLAGLRTLQKHNPDLTFYGEGAEEYFKKLIRQEKNSPEFKISKSPSLTFSSRNQAPNQPLFQEDPQTPSPCRDDMNKIEMR